MKELWYFARTVWGSWYFWGIVGWGLVLANYPLEVIIPRYAG